MDTSVIFGHNADVMFDDTLAEVFPALVGFLVGRLGWGNIEDICRAEVGTEEFGYFWPSHKFVDSKELEELCIERDLSVSSVLVDAVEKIGLFVVVGCEDNIVNNSLQNLKS